MVKRVSKPARARGAPKPAAKSAELSELRNRNAAINQSMAMVEYALDGTILDANGNYLKLMGYTLEELRGKHVDILLDAAQRSGGGSQGNLEKLRRGEHIAALQKRIAKDGRRLWVQASVNPIKDAAGKPYKAITYLSDVTVQVQAAAETKGVVAAINRAQAVIEFALDGSILAANENFLDATGYTLEEIRGQHHRMFVEPAHAASEEYRRFWEKLGQGEYDAGQYKRLAKGGREIWIQASYNPILDADGKAYKVVKFATDITAQRREAEMNAAFKGALENLLSNVMVTDGALNIIYLNAPVQALLKEAQGDIRRDLPQFDATRLIGTGLDSLQKGGAGGRGLLADLEQTSSAQLELGGRSFRLIANPMRNEAGKRIGTVVEWADRTQELRVEEEVAQIVSRALENDLSLRVDLEGKSAFFARLGAGLNQLLDNVASMVRDIKAAAAAVRIGAEEISKGNTNLSQRTEEQSSSLEETASSMEEMTSTVKQNADNAGQANQLATAARDQAEKGGAVTAKAMRAMTEINDASKKIADIISVIDEIAFQTNLLALNAAVEAARAGEQGRGFAVVASEVRNLAGRSATAAKEIKGLIKDSVRKVEDGSALVTQSGQTLEQIVASVKKVSDIIAEIAAASREQSSGIEQVNKAVIQMDEMTQQNAALVEEATAASQAMAEGAGELNRMMERFTLPGAPAPAAASAAPATAAAAPAAERRAASRPWSGKGKDAVERPQAKAAAGNDWQDF
ncbi:MAG: PAS domain S-box protein [Gammaproteobacteria bacterium]|nr:PAS domain S-box protein [Gammaproteobacteria bacterium]